MSRLTTRELDMRAAVKEEALRWFSTPLPAGVSMASYADTVAMLEARPPTISRQPHWTQRGGEALKLTIPASAVDVMRRGLDWGGSRYRFSRGAAWALLSSRGAIEAWGGALPANEFARRLIVGNAIQAALLARRVSRIKREDAAAAAAPAKSRWWRRR